MCGIVGYTGSRDAVGVLLEGLRRLEYRGYDSSGIAVAGEGAIGLRRAVGKLKNLSAEVEARPLEGTTGIGHTRWATHGRPSEENAHPHLEGGVAVVHNGIIENYLELRDELSAEGSEFKSETDTEILAHLIRRETARGLGLADAVRAAVRHVKGTYALAAVCEAEPGIVVGARMECPLIAGAGDGEAVLCSDIPAMLDVTRKAFFLNDGEIAVISSEGVEITDSEGMAVTREPTVIDWSPVMAEKGGYRHFMLKEIFEQPGAVADTFRGLVSHATGDVFLDGFGLDIDHVERICIVACGTAWHAGLVGRSYFEEFFGVPTEADLASEFRYRNPLVGEKTLVVAVSQSGETADTLAAVREARERGAEVVSVCNVMESSLTRESSWSFMTHAGPEIGVASTKAFTTQIVALYLMALHFGRSTGRLSAERGRELVGDMLRLPKLIERALDTDARVKELSRKYFHMRNFMFLGRGINFPIALEGALKLKEVSYIHAEGYAAGEMKHGPIALIDSDVPVVALVPSGPVRAKMLSNIEEVRARGGRILAVVEEGDEDASSRADDVIEVPAASGHLAPVVLSIPLQLLAYHVAVEKGTDVDQPRNLAKSVTVE